jgi:McbB family protein
MLYARTPVSLQHNKNTSLLYTQKGMFIIDDQGMGELLRFLEKTNFISKEEISHEWDKKNRHDVSITEVMSYLTEETLMLVKIGNEFSLRRTCFISNGAVDKPVIKNLISESDMIHYNDFMNEDRSNLPGKFLLVFDMLKWTPGEEIERIQEKIDDDTISIFLFQIGEYFLISHAFCKSKVLPCILCLHDYVMDKFLNDNTNKPNSIYDAINFISENYDINIPNAAIDDLDLAYLIREVRQYLLTLSGNGRGIFSGCDVNRAKIINIYTLEKSELTIPFSPRCGCLHKYHNARR